MRNLSLFCLFVCLIPTTSCSKYYYSVVNAHHSVQRNELGDFVQEDEKVSILYSFFGQNLPVQITVQNKTDQPLFVDWQQSALIVEDAATSYVDRNLEIRGTAHSKTYNYRGYYFPIEDESTGTRYSGNAKLPEEVSFIPPGSKIVHTPIVLSNFSFENIPDTEYEKKPLYIAEARSKNVKVIDYTFTSSPLRFRSYLTLYTVRPNGERDGSMVYEQGFYISRLIKAGTLEPRNFSDYNQQRGDFFFVRDDRGQNAGVIAGLVAIGITGVVLEATLTGY